MLILRFSELLFLLGLRTFYIKFQIYLISSFASSRADFWKTILFHAFPNIPSNIVYSLTFSSLSVFLLLSLRSHMFCFSFSFVLNSHRHMRYLNWLRLVGNSGFTDMRKPLSSYKNSSLSTTFAKEINYGSWHPISTGLPLSSWTQLIGQ